MTAGGVSTPSVSWGSDSTATTSTPSASDISVEERDKVVSVVRALTAVGASGARTVMASCTPTDPMLVLWRRLWCTDREISEVPIPSRRLARLKVIAERLTAVASSARRSLHVMVGEDAGGGGEGGGDGAGGNGGGAGGEGGTLGGAGGEGGEGGGKGTGDAGGAGGAGGVTQLVRSARACSYAAIKVCSSTVRGSLSQSSQYPGGEGGAGGEGGEGGPEGGGDGALGGGDGGGNS